jgi:hypothetical protein
VRRGWTTILNTFTLWGWACLLGKLDLFHGLYPLLVYRRLTKTIQLFSRRARSAQPPQGRIPTIEPLF